MTNSLSKLWEWMTPDEQERYRNLRIRSDVVEQRQATHPDKLWRNMWVDEIAADIEDMKTEMSQIEQAALERKKAAE